MALALRRRIRGSSVARTPINGPRRLASRSKCIPWPCVVVAVLLVLAINFSYNADNAKLFYETSHNLLDVHLKNLYQTHLPPHSQSLSRSGEEENVEIGTIIETQANSHSHPPILYGHVHMAKTGGGPATHQVEAGTGEKEESTKSDKFQSEECAQVLITSQGGVGSSNFLLQLKGLVRTNAHNDEDRLKHKAASCWEMHDSSSLIKIIPKIQQTTNKRLCFSKVLVIIGDPLHTIER